jgi:flagellar biosynthesis protein FliP
MNRFARITRPRAPWCSITAVLIALLSAALPAALADAAEPAASPAFDPSSLITTQSVSSSLPWMIGAAVLSVVPAVLLMSTCFVRFAVLV